MIDAPRAHAQNTHARAHLRVCVQYAAKIEDTFQFKLAVMEKHAERLAAAIDAIKCAFSRSLTSKLLPLAFMSLV